MRSLDNVGVRMKVHSTILNSLVEDVGALFHPEHPFLDRAYVWQKCLRSTTSMA